MSCRPASSLRCRSSPIPTIPRRPKSCWPRPATRTASRVATFILGRPISRPARPSPTTSRRSASRRGCARCRAAMFAALATKKLKGLCMCVNAVYGNAASRLSETVPHDGAFAYGSFPDIDELYRRQALESDSKQREALLHQIQRLVFERVRFAPIFDYIWPSGVGPRVAEPALMLINPYPWSAPLEEVRLRAN